jgi:hypothetical protein
MGRYRMSLRVQGFVFAAFLSLLWTGQSHGDGNQQPDAAAASACAAGVESAAVLNATALFEGALSCAKADRQEDSNFFLILGQVRAISDLTIFTPTDDAASAKAAALYGQLYYQFGGLGFWEVYRSPEDADALEARIRAADLSLSGYDPGWSYRPQSKTDVYLDVLANQREKRLWQMRNLCLKLQDPEYYEAYRALYELQRDNPTLQQGSPAYQEYLQLMERMGLAEKDIPQLPPPADTTPYARLNEQDPELAERQVATGFNGPATQGAYLFQSESEVRQSWLAAALTAQEIEALVARTDFSSQVLVAFSFGQRMNATAQILISDLSYRAGGYSIATRIGVVPESCGVAFAESYPFVVGVTEAVPGARIQGSGTSNFAADCGPVAAGKATVQN